MSRASCFAVPHTGVSTYRISAGKWLSRARCNPLRGSLRIRCSGDTALVNDEQEPAPVYKRRVRYSGTHPKRFQEKYKELRGDKDILKHVEAKGSTAAGTHRSIAVQEILEILQPAPGMVYVDCTLGYGGHAAEILKLITPGGRLIGLDADSDELKKTEERLLALGFPTESVTCCHSNYAAVSSVALEQEPEGVDILLADLGLSSMQIDDPMRGISFKADGPLDMRLDCSKGKTASEWLQTWDVATLAELLRTNSDEERADDIAAAVLRENKRETIVTTSQLVAAVRRGLPKKTPEEEVQATTRRVFQAIRIA
eukprot:5753756-Pyramimonas_sp.AAC.3